MKKGIRTLTFYLPQFHRVAENDEWWGEGFTEWTALRKAEPLYEGHKQPIRPLNNNYYNLLEKSTMEWQSSLMKKYGIDGQCFYHYYFKDGRKILEKPAENLLQWKEIDMPFCFCWANGRWARTWSNLEGNSWADKFENKSKSTDCGVLIEQNYGREEEWKAHFEYLLPFFSDDRYIKINGSPVFLFYHPDTIPCLPQMIDYWNKLAQENQLQTFYFIGMHSYKNLHGLDALVLQAPHMVWKLEPAIDGIHFIDYDLLWENICRKSLINGNKTYYCGVPNLDDTPRRGRHDGVLFKNFSIDSFYKGMCEIYKKSLKVNNEFVFINSWNEWGEGMQLEPDEEYGYGKLDAVLRAQKDVLETDDGFISTDNREVSEGYAENNAINSYFATAQCFDRWMELRERNIRVSDYLKRYDITQVAVYGYGMLGKHLIGELEEQNIKIAYIIDRDYRKQSLRYEIRNPQDNLPQVDAIIVTVVDEFDNIYQSLKSRVNSKFFSLFEIVSEL